VESSLRVVAVSSCKMDCMEVDRFSIYTILPLGVYFFTYWALSAMFTVLDHLLVQLSNTKKSPGKTTWWLDRFKAQKGLTEERLHFKLSHLFHVLALQLFVTLPVGLALGTLWPAFPTFSVCLSSSSSTWLPELLLPQPPLRITVTRFILEFLAILLLFEVFFFYSHLTLHQKPFYKLFHKLHHHYTAPIAPAAHYAHWVEHLVSNTIAPILPGIIIGAHPVTVNVWFLLATMTVVCSHSGYGRYAIITSEEHDLHHKYFTVNYGTLTFLDWLHGTTYAQSAQCLRDKQKREEQEKRNKQS